MPGTVGVVLREPIRPPESHRYPQLDPVVGRVDQILLGAEVPLSRLDTRVAKQQLDLLKFGPGCSAEFGAGAASVVRRDASDAGSFGIRL